ncbi:MAG: HD domain-containing protein [Deltaproteobacteria bacterium]|nr:HD domain-containing protein [Candidatus Anaeroferrophillus wilburensis]MBN2888850.1 HD domain-containing protein [Deltaproteobacteria bacterium]
MKLYLNELQEHQNVETVVLVSKKTVARSRKDKEYIALKVMDKSAEISAHIWDNVPVYRDRFAEEDYVLLKGRVVAFQGALQINVTHLELFNGEVDPRDFLPQTTKNIGNLLRTLQAAVREVKNPWLARLLADFFIKDSEFLACFQLAPAAKAMHHAYLGGLLEHTVGVLQLALQIAPLYPQLDQDLLVAGALLHDIGKVVELGYEKSFTYTARGRLLGHIVIGAEMVAAKVAKINGFPESLLILLEHLLLSHHGDYQWGSPKRPKTPEAFMLHYLDDMDAKMNAIDSFYAAQGGKGAAWSDFNRVFERYFLLDSKKMMPEPDDQSASLPPSPDHQKPTLF